MAWSVGNSAWADRVEGEDEVPPPPVLPAFAQEESFPTLGAAASMPQPTKKDKKKGGKPAKMSLADFNSGATTGSYKARGPSGGAYSSGYGRSKPNDDDILSQLPKGPAGYVQEEQGGIGGGFKEYGGNRGGEPLFCSTGRSSLRLLAPLLFSILPATSPSRSVDCCRICVNPLLLSCSQQPCCLH